MADNDEVGRNAPVVRMPAKTMLSNVLLCSNPWEERDLDKKLSKLNHLQKRREKTLEWNQRQFFVQQIFDGDHRLRFSGQQPNEPELVMETQSSQPLLPTSKNGMGIFSTPHPLSLKSPRFKEIKRTAKKLGLAYDDDRKRLPFIKRNKTVEFAEEDNESVTSAATFPQTFPAVTKPLQKRAPTMSALKRSLSQGLHPTTPIIKLSKSNSLPNINMNDYMRKHSVPKIDEDIVICDNEVITKLTRTLPVTLMLKANKNLNAVIDERKQALKEKSRGIYERDLFADPRWEKLQRSLVAD